MPRVLRVLTRLNIGGPSRHALLLHRGLASLGWDCVLACGSSEGAEGDYTDWDPVDVVRVPGLRRGASPADAARATAALRAHVRRLRPDVVHTHMAMAGFTGRLAALTSAPGARRVHTFHGHVLEGYFTAGRARAFTAAERALALATHRLVAVSEHVRDELLALGVGRPSRWTVVPVGLDLSALLAMPATLPGTRTIGVVGRLVEIKDHATLFQAVRSMPDVRLLVAGDGDLRGALERSAPPNVEFLGWVRDLPALYSRLDAVVLTSRNEGTPVALIEAMAAARPVVATHVGGVPDVVVDGVTGILVGAGDPAAVAGAVRRVLGAEAPDMGRAGRAAVESRFAASRLVADVDRLYRKLLGMPIR